MTNEEQDTKQAVMECFKEERRLRCPNCKNDRFRRREDCFCYVVKKDDGVYDEDISSVEYIYVCPECDMGFTDDKLI